MPVPLGPQEIHVSAHMKRDGHEAIIVSVSLCGEGNFAWESWRDCFSSRLGNVSKWQQQNGLAHCLSPKQKEVSPWEYELQIFVRSELESICVFGKDGCHTEIISACSR